MHAIIAKIDPEVIAIIVMIVIFVVVPAIIERMSKAQKKRQQEAARSGETVYEADKGDVRRYLDSVGPGGKSQRQEPATPTRQTRPAAQASSPASEVKRYLQSLGVKVDDKPKRQQPQAPRPAPAPKPRPAPPEPAGMIFEPEEEPRPAPILLAEASPALPALPSGRALGKKPTPAELRRAVILAEVVRRPDFDRLPYERSKG